MTERTLSIIKPDAILRHLSGSINAMIEADGLHIIAQRRLQLTIPQARTFYQVHEERSFFNDLVSYMVSAPVLVQVLEAENCVARYRELMGATNPSGAKEGTIRHLHGTSVEENAVHGSDSIDNAKIEIAYFFAQIDILSTK